MLMTIFAALSMVTDLHYYSGKDINLRNSVSTLWILIIILGFALVSHSPAEIFFLMLFGYLISGYVTYFKENFQIKK